MPPSDPSSGQWATAPSSDLAGELAKQIERLANELFSGVPGPALNVAPPAAPASALTSPGVAPVNVPGALVPPNPAPSALNVGAGGASPAVALPPVPGVLHRPPLAAAPPPKESDLRAIPMQLSENLGLPSPIALASMREPSAGTPYFLGLAGLPPGDPPQIPGPRTPTEASAPFASAPSPPASAPMAVPTGDVTRVPAQPFAATPDLSPLGLASPSELSVGTPYFLELAGLPVAELRAPTDAMAAPSASTPLATSSPDAYVAFPTDAGDFTRVPVLPAAAEPANDAALRSLPSAPTAPTSAGYDFRPEVIPDARLSSGIFDPHAIKADFPILQERVHGRQLVWLDNAATTQKPREVIERISFYYERENSNVHRAAHTLAARATDAYEGARDKVRRFLNAPTPKQIVFVRGATEGINLVAQSWGRRNIGPGDEIVITWLEHHANIVPWQMLCLDKGARLRVAPVDDRGQVMLDEYEKLLGPRTRLVSLSQVSNALGTVVPAREMVEIAHRHGARVMVDGAQAVSHMPVDVQALDCDFYSFSGHKVFAPTGIGVLYGKADLLETMPPWQGGGNMISDVTFERTTYQAPPWRFEAGTGSIADAVGLGAAIDYVSALGLENVKRYEHELLVYAEERLARVPGLRMIGTAPDKAGVMSFVLDGVRTEEVGGILDQEGIAVRSGHHCAQPILRRFGLESTVRASLAPYNTCEDIDALVAALLRIQAGRPPRGL
jgi:cysteine desulfurase / selenocysteine lyase